MEEQIKKYLEVPASLAMQEKKLLIAKKSKKEMINEWILQGDTYRVVIQNVAHILKSTNNQILRQNFDDVCNFAHFYTLKCAKKRAQPCLFLSETKEEFLNYLISSLEARIKNIFGKKKRKEKEEFFKNYINLYYKTRWAVARLEDQEELEYATAIKK